MKSLSDSTAAYSRSFAGSFSLLSKLSRNFLLVCGVWTLAPTLAIASDASSATNLAPGSLKSEVLLFLPKSEVLTRTAGLTGDFQVVKESLTLSGDLPVQLAGLDLSLRYKVASVTPLEGGQFQVRLAVESLSAKIADLNIDSVILMETNGVKARIPIKAHCRDLQVSVRSPLNMEMTGQVREAEGLEAEIQSLVWDRSNTQWLQVSAPTCEAAPGFEAFLGEQINRYWNTSTEIGDLLKAEINAEIPKLMGRALEFRHELAPLGSSIGFKIKRLTDTEKTWILGLDLEVAMTDRCSLLETNPFVPQVSTQETPGSVELWLPEKLLEIWTRCLHETGRFTRDDQGRDIAGFQRLMRSRFLQFFVWPDLMSFPKDTPFVFRSRSYGGFQLSPRQANKGLNYAFQTALQTAMFYPSKGGMAPYMSFWSPVAGNVGVSVTDSKLQLKLTSSSKLNLKYRYDGGRRGSVAVGLLQGEVRDALVGSVYTVELPQFKWGPGLHYEASGVSRSGATLKIQLKSK